MHVDEHFCPSVNGRTRLATPFLPANRSGAGALQSPVGRRQSFYGSCVRLRVLAYNGYAVQTCVFLTLTFLAASCGSVEVAKQSRSLGAPDAPPEPQTKRDPTAPEPASEEVDPADRRETALREWLEQATQDCDKKRDPEAYLPLREGVSKESVALVKARCTGRTETAIPKQTARTGVLTDALKSAAMSYAKR